MTAQLAIRVEQRRWDNVLREAPVPRQWHEQWSRSHHWSPVNQAEGERAPWQPWVRDAMPIDSADRLHRRDASLKLPPLDDPNNVSKLLRPEVIRPRVRVGDNVLIGPGKIELLRAVAQHGSISRAARSLGMGYKRAWSLLDELQQASTKPLIETSAGGVEGGGAKVTAAALKLIAEYDELERACREAAAPALTKLARLLRK